MQGFSVLAIGSFVCGTVSQTVLILIHLVLLRDRYAYYSQVLANFCKVHFI